jgi:peroxiredoxin
MKTSHIKAVLEAMAGSCAAAFAAGCLFLAATAVSGADELGITVSGTGEYSVFDGSQAPPHSATYNFQASVAGRAWIIRYAQTADSRNADTLNAEAVASCDGTNIYLIQFQNEAAVRRVWGDRYESMKAQLPVAMATIYPGDYPPGQEFALQNIWRAFASSSVLPWTTNETQPGFRQLILKTDGFTNGVGIWSEVTNIAGVSVPTEFEFTAFSQAARNGSVVLLTASTDRCTVTNVGSAAIPSVPTPLPFGRVLVTDHRLDKSKDPRYPDSTYLTTTGRWLPDEVDFVALAASQSVKLNVGDRAPDFTFKTFKGNLLRLSDLRGKYVLLDFWATTCVPCLKQIPELTATYEAFGKDKQFAIVSLSLDTAEAEPRKFVAARGIAWTQGFLDKQLKASVQQAYGFNAIPQVLLLGPDGKIVEKDLRGAAVQNAVESALRSR